DMQEMARALSRAWAKTGKRIAAKMAMIAITTRSSMSVKPRRVRRGPEQYISGSPSRAELRGAQAASAGRPVHGSGGSACLPAVMGATAEYTTEEASVSRAGPDGQPGQRLLWHP